MANDKDRLFEQIYFFWKGEGEKRTQSIDWYSEQYGTSIDEYRKLPMRPKSVGEILGDGGLG